MQIYEFKKKHVFNKFPNRFKIFHTVDFGKKVLVRKLFYDYLNHKQEVMNKCFVPVFVSFLLSTASLLAHDICLNGVWEYGYARHYDNKGAVPGIHTETSRAGEDTLWYRKDIVLPRGDWEDAVLELKGARFRPEIYINNELCARAEGGMIRTFHQLTSSAIKPGAAVRLEIALASLKDVPKEDASRIPEVDQWRSHCASVLWDDVVLHLYRKAYIDRALTWYNHDSRDCKISFRICGSGEYNAHISISDKEEVVFATDCHATPGDNYVQMAWANGRPRHLSAIP